MSLLAPTLQAFFTDRLIGQKHVSAHTIAAYRDTIRLLLAFAAEQTSKAPSDLDLDDLQAPLIGAFLDHLEHERGNTIRTRNARLAAIRSLFKYAALRHPEHAASIQRVLAIPTKRHDQALVTFLTDPELQALLDAPDQTAWIGRRDHALILLAAQTGLRASELDRTYLRGPAARDRRARQLRRQGPQATHHALDQPDHHGHARVDPGTQRPAGLPAVRDQHRPASDPRRARTPTRQTRRHGSGDLPNARDQDDHAARAASHRRDAPTPRRRRHHRDRALARSLCG